MERKLMDKEALRQKLPLHLGDYFISAFEKCERSQKTEINRFEITEQGNYMVVYGYDAKGRTYHVGEEIIKTPRSELDDK